MFIIKSFWRSIQELFVSAVLKSLTIYNVYVAAIIYLNKGKSSIPLFGSHKLIGKKKSEIQTRTKGNTSTIREKQRKNRNTAVHKKQTTMQHHRIEL